MNRVQLIGRLGHDPSLRDAGGKPVASLSVATTESWGKGDQRQERTEWHRVTVWGKPAEWIKERGRKGDKVFVEGRIESRKYTDKLGVEKTAYEVVTNQPVEIIQTGRGSSTPAAPDYGPPADGDIPF